MIGPIGYHLDFDCPRIYHDLPMICMIFECMIMYAPESRHVFFPENHGIMNA